MAEAKYRVGIIGGGRMGTHHGRAYALHPMIEVVAVADTDEENRQLFAQRFGARPYVDYEEMLAVEKPDITGAILPVKEHADAVVAAAAAGVRAVFCEKPMTALLADADRMVAACQERGAIFAAGVVPRNYPEYWKARDLVDAGEIGDVQSIYLCDNNGQGGCHGINLALMFAGDCEVDWGIGWVGGDPFSDEDGDGALEGIGGYFRFANGIEVFCNNRLSVRQRAGESGQGFEVVGTRGIIWNDYNGLHMARAQDGYEPGQRAQLYEVEEVFEDTRNIDPPAFDQEGWKLPTPGMRASVAALVAALESGQAPRLSTGQSLRQALEICIGLRESARRNQAPVKFPLPDRSLVMYPVPARWNFKKEVYGREAYMEQLAGWTRS